MFYMYYTVSPVAPYTTTSYLRSKKFALTMRLWLYFEFCSKDDRAEAEKLRRGCEYWRRVSVEKERKKMKKKRKRKKEKKVLVRSKTRRAFIANT